MPHSNPATSGTKTIFIVGDDTISVLNPRIMSDARITVKIKTHKGANVQAIKDSLLKTMEDNRSYMSSINTIVLHSGASNISDSESAESITQKIKNVAETVKNANSQCQILISSILPRRNDRPTNNAIHETNRVLQAMCQEYNYHYIDNRKNFTSSGKPEYSLYKDGINLNRKGARFLGQNMKEKVSSIILAYSQDPR